MQIKTLFEPRSMSNSPPKKRTWGFRFTPSDAVAIVVFISVAAVFQHSGSPLWWMLLIAAGHFFLFCNVFRIIRRRELIWAGLFILNIGLWLWFGELTWSCILACQLPVTVVLIFADMRSPGYHGIFAKQLNPQLNDYLEGRL
jgi:cell division protein FtsW (lipid II flippase)